VQVNVRELIERYNAAWNAHDVAASHRPRETG